MGISQLLVRTPDTRVGAPRYSLLVAGDEERLAAQRLRHRVFVTELGARLPDTPATAAGVDADRFDEHCDHLVVRDDDSGAIVGTYRMLPPDRAAAAGGLYCAGEFTVDALAPLRPSLVETGRSCVDPEHRTGAVVGLVWAGLARYLLLTGNRWLIGCASVPLRTPGDPDGAVVAGVWDRVRADHLAPEEYRMRPLRPVDVDTVTRPARSVLPPLLRGYVRLGAWVCGPPARDDDFGVADFPVLLGMHLMDPRYRRHFLGTS